MNRRLNRWLTLMFMLAALVALLLPVVAWARAGGGGDFGGGGSGGGGFGGGGGSGGGGGGDLIAWLFWLCLRRPLIGIPLVIVLVLLIAYGGRSARSVQMASVIRRGKRVQQSDDLVRALTALTAHDRLFQRDGFLARVSNAFLKIQDAWSRQDLKPIRPFVSDGIYERFALYLEMQKADGIRNQMDDVCVHRGEIAAVLTDDRFETIHVMFDASATDCDVDLESGRRVESPTIGSFVEYWSFHRRTGAGTLSRDGSMEGNCPNCAAPLDIVDSAKCPACGSIVNSGEHDWVLAEITQDSEWKVPSPDRQVSGLAQLKATDPGFSVQHVEDRASVMFWRLVASEFFGDPDYATPILAQQIVADQKANILIRTMQKQFWKEPAVGRVEVLDVNASDDNGMDRIRVLIRWSGILCERKPRGRASVLRDKTIYNSVYVLARQRGVKTLADHVFSSAACLQCGAPVAVSKEPTCSFCGTLLVDGRHDWVLESIGSYSSDLAYGGRLLDEPRSRLPAAGDGDIDGDLGREMSLAILVRVMNVDGRFDEREREALIKIGMKRNLSRNRVETILNTAGAQEVELPVPRDPREARYFVAQLVRAALADGNVTLREQRLLVRCAERFGMSKADVRMAIARERRLEYQQSRDVLRNHRRNGGGSTVSARLV